MYKVYIFTYKGVNNKIVTDTIKKETAWYRFDDSSFILCTKLTVDNLIKKITPYIDVEKDKYLFMQINIVYYKGLLPSDIWEWLKKQLIKTKQIK
jgi:hypothetical protein